MELPEGWTKSNLQELASVDSGQGAPQGEKWYNGEMVFVKAGDLNFLSAGKYVGEYCKRISNVAITKYKLKKYQKNSVVFPKSGMSVKTDNIALLKYDSYVVNHLAIIQTKNNSENLAKYIYYLLKHMKVSQLSLNEAYPSIRLSDLKKLKVILPPPEHLTKIVAILEKAEKLQELRHESGKLTDDYLVSIFCKTFGDPINNPKNFDVIKLRSVFSKSRSGSRCGPFGSALKKNEYTDSGIPVWTMDNIINGTFSEKNCLHISEKKFRELQAYSVENGDIIISRAGTVGKMAVVQTSVPKSIISTNLIRLSLDKSMVSPIFFVCLMEYFKGRVGRLKTGPDGAYTFMNTSVLENLEIPLPPISVQKAFEGIFNKTNKIKDMQLKTKKSLIELSDLIAGKVFTGDLLC